jgi:hypothetical protein
MELYHRIGFNSKLDNEFLTTVVDRGIPYKSTLLPGGSSSLIVFEIYESDPNWEMVSKYIQSTNASNMLETIFSDEEIRNAEWLRLIPTFELGYPQPKSDWPIKQLSYEIQCPKCCIYRQINNMRMAKEPSLRNNSFMTFIWTRDAICTPEVIQGLEKIQARGYEVWNLINHKTNEPIENVRQLYVSGVTSPGLLMVDNLKRVICPECGTIKYNPHVQGIMHLKREALPPNTDFLMTHEWFGHGLLAWREILVSNRIANLILDSGWKGVRFKVVEIN